VDPLNGIQAFIEIGALYELTTMLRAGTFPGVSAAFKKVVHVGHSFGAAQTYGLVAMYPHASDGIVLTGFSMNASFVGLFFAGGNFVQANQNTPRFAAYPKGYLASSDSSANEYLFLLPGYFDPHIVTVAEATKQPVTVGELLTLGSAPAINPYTGPVLVITGGRHPLSLS
jgi:pimeloyl-ACP methyl ester carboxylesterase